MVTAKSGKGLILCECGNNISSFIDLNVVSKWAIANNKVDFVVKHELLCSPPGKDYVREIFQKYQPDKLIIAACSPRQHEQTFQTIAEECGSNIAAVHMANIREQAAWVTPIKKEATAKAIALINAAILRLDYHEKLEKRSIDVITDIVIIGGGIAGMEAALLAAQAGRQVTIIEKNIALGGHIMQAEELAPNMECAPCLLSPRLFKINSEPNITVLSNTELTDVVGFYGNFTVKVKQRARFVRSSCIGCEACFEVCPVSVKHEFHLGLGERKAIYDLYPGAIPAMAAIDKEHCLHFIDGSCSACATACPFLSVDFEDNDQTFELPAGAIILATGFENFNPEQFQSLGYKQLDNVLTLPEFERMANSNGPTQGSIQLKNGSKPKRVAVLHCAGSLNQAGVAYCSGICCQLAAKVGALVRKQVPDTQVFNLHDRLVFQGPEANLFFEEQKNQGTQFIQTERLDQVSVFQENNNLIIQAIDQEKLEADLVVLATGITAANDVPLLSNLMHLDLTTAGFFMADHFFLRSVASGMDGIYAVGGCSGPCLANEAVRQAQAAAGEAISRLIPGRKIELEVMTACIDNVLCAGCKLCISVCPYRAVSADKEKHIAIVNEAICKGCGTCVANCPSGAAKARHFTNAQIEAEIKGVLDD